VRVELERPLQHEVMLRLQSAPLAALVFPIPNGIYLPARTPAEKTLVARVIYQLKLQGGLVPGAPDLVFLGPRSCGAIELKRPATRTLFGKHARGSLSPVQRAMQKSFAQHGVNYAICESWDEVRDILVSWQMLPGDWGRPPTHQKGAYGPEMTKAPRRATAEGPDTGTRNHQGMTRMRQRTSQCVVTANRKLAIPTP
jgi:hypothetical protein